MSLAIFRSARVEDLAAALAGQLRQEARDPFEPVAVVVGSRGMERWLRHQLATHLGIAANIVFPFPRQALDGLGLALLAGDDRADRPCWIPAQDSGLDCWQPDALTFAVLAAVRERLAQPEFSVVRGYLQLDQQADAATIANRELAFAREVADVLDKLLHDRHSDALLWAAQPAEAGPHRWLAELLAALGAADAQSPAQVRARLLRLQPGKAQGGPPLRLFCLSTLGPADRELLQALAGQCAVELYLLAPSRVWWADIRSRPEHYRALQRAESPLALEALQQERASHNKLLSALGIPSRDVQVWLETLRYQEADVAQPPAEPTTDLQRLQRWVDDAGDALGLSQAGLQGDGTIAIHSCWGPLRQVEVLRDQLLKLFQDFPGQIEPRDVAVMTPDIETFAPLVAAVFARRGPLVPAVNQPDVGPLGGDDEPRLDDRDAAQDGATRPGRAPQLPAIAVSIADLGLVRVNPVAEVLLAVLALADGRITAPQVYALLALEPVRQRLELSVDDVADLRELIDESGMRWALDESDRGAAGQPELFQNTLGFGMERLALGALMADPEPLELLAVGGADVVPLPVRTAERAGRVAALGQLINAIGAVRQRQRVRARGRTLRQWQAEWHTILSDFARTNDAASWLTARVRRELADFVQAGGDFAGLLSLDAVRRSLAGRFDLSVQGDRVITGAVTVCALQPMRSVPFQVIALLGMDDGSFPRARHRRAWDPFSQPKAGEVDPRLAQRHLLLETLLSARQRLMILYNGYGKKPLEIFAPAVPVVELRDLLVEASGLPMDRWVTSHPLQPWSPQAFAGPRFTYSRATADAATALLLVQTGEREAQAMGLAATDHDQCTPEPNPPLHLSLGELVRGLVNAQDMFLRERLQVAMPRPQAELQDREPIEMSALDRWGVRDEVMQALLDRRTADNGVLAETLTRRLQAEGRLPLEAGGRRMVAEAYQDVTELLNYFSQAQGQVTTSPDLLRVDVAVRRQDRRLVVRLQAAALAQRQVGDLAMLEWIAPSKSAKAKNLLTTWVYLLAVRASGGSATAARVVGEGDKPSAKRAGNPAKVAGKLLTSSLQAEQAQALLADLVQVWLACRDRPMPLFAETSWAYAQNASAGAVKLRSAVRAKWGTTEDEGDAFGAGEGSYASNRALFGDWDPLEHLDPQEGENSFAGLALRVFGALAEALEAGPAVAAPFYQAAGAEEAA